MSAEGLSPGISAVAFSAPSEGISRGTGIAELGGSIASKGSIGSMESGPMSSGKSFGGSDQTGMFGKTSPIGSTQSFSEFSPIGKVSSESFEGPMKGISPFQGTDVLAKASTDSPLATTEPKINVFTDTVPMTVSLETINEGPAPRSVLSETNTIFEAPRIASEPAVTPAVQAEVALEAVLNAEPESEIQAIQAPTIGIEAENETIDAGVNRAIESYFESNEEFQSIATPENVDRLMSDIKSDDPDTYVELARDMKVVGEVQRLIQEADIEPELAGKIEKSAIETAVSKAGVTEAAETLIDEQADPEARGETEIDGNGDRTRNGQTEPDAKYPDPDQKEAQDDPRDPEREGKLRVKDEPVNARRAESTYQAIDRVFDEKSLGEMVEGQEIVPELDSFASSGYASGMAQELHIDDGTYYGFLAALGEEEFEENDRLGARARVYELVNEHTGIRSGNSGQTVSQRNIDELLSGRAKAKAF